MNEEIYFIREENILEIPKVLKKGIFNRIHYEIISLGSHPTAYIRIPKGSEINKANYEDIDINVHGGLTYKGKINDEGFLWIGWDYAHYGDYRENISRFHLEDGKSGKKWTINEIEQECFKAIIQLKKLKKFQYEKYYYSLKKSNWR